ncbi:hypothetical protein APC1466_1893 [Bifidobacterium longum]|nr:hypothetical protein APC1466_1893 [Bifidobacterium longum]PKD07009.1 hypothetical protein APC1465_1938 [Bifidobacterium longum]
MILIGKPIDTTPNKPCSYHMHEPRGEAKESRNFEARRQVKNREYVRSFDSVKELREFFDAI